KVPRAWYSSSIAAPTVAALIGASSKVKLTIGPVLRSRNGAGRRSRAKRLLTRALNADHAGCMISVLSPTHTMVAAPGGRSRSGADNSADTNHLPVISRNRRSLLVLPEVEVMRHRGPAPPERYRSQLPNSAVAAVPVAISGRSVRTGSSAL